MVIESGASSNLWNEAILTAHYVLNRMSHKKTNITFWAVEKVKFGIFKGWSYLAFVRLIDHKIPKLGVRTIVCAFLELQVNSTAYKFLNTENIIIFESTDFIFSWR